jgi:GntR family transcriptional regulator
VRDPLPKYFVIKRVLEARLERDYALGARLPSEKLLCSDFGVSRITIQQALNQLEKQGTIERQQGRGTFYVGPPRRRTETEPSELLETVMKYREGAGMRVLRHAVERATSHVADRLDLPVGTSVVAIDRLGFVEHEPIAFIEAYLPEMVGRRVLEDRGLLAQQTIGSVLTDRHGLAIDSVTQTIGAGLADPRFARHLGVEIGAPVIEGERTYRDATGRPIFLSVAFYRADRHRFAVTLKQWR